MATTTWKGGAGNFATSSLWTNGAVPGPGDVAVIDASSGSASILLSGSQSVAGLTLDDSDATLNLAGDLSLNSGTFSALAGTLALSGTLEGGTLALGGASLVVSGTTAELLNLAVSGSLDLGSGGTLSVSGLQTGSLQQISIGAGSQLVLLDDETFTNVTIDLAGGVIATSESDTTTGGLTIGFGTVLTQNAAGTTARIGPTLHDALLGLGAVINRGTVVAAAGTLDLDAEGGAFTSQFGLGPFTNLGTIQIEAGATVVLNTVATLAGLGTIVNNGGLLDLKGTLNLTGSTLDVGAANGFSNLRLDGVVNGGAIVEDGGALQVGTASLLGVAVTGSGLTFDTLTIGPGTTFNPAGGAFTLTASAAAYGQIYLRDGADLANANIAYGGSQYRVQLLVTGGATPTATLDASTVLNVGKGQVLVLDAGTNGTLINNAVINVAAGGRLEFDNAASYVSGGTINLAAGATVALNGNIGLAALTNIVGSGATLINTGNLDLKGGTISTAGDANFSLFFNQGSVTNGTVVTFAGQNPNLGIIAGGGTLVTGPGVLPVNSVTLNNATVKGDLQLQVNGTLAIYGDTRFSNADGTGPGSIVLNQQPSLYVMGSATSLQFNASATLSNANVLLSGITPDLLGSAFTADPDINIQLGSTATFAPDVTIIATTVNGPISGIGNKGFAVNKGRIVVSAGADFFICPYGSLYYSSATGQDFVNQGVIDIAAGGVFDVYETSVSIASLGTILGTGGLLRLDASLGNAPYDNTGNTIHVGGASGAPDLELDGATISGGAIENDGGNFSSIGGTLSNVAYTGALHVGSAKDIYGNSQSGSLTFQGGSLNSQSVTVDSGAALLLGADQSFAGATITLAGELADTGHTLTLDAATTVSVTGASALTAQHILNAGAIVVGPGATLNLTDASAATTPETSIAGTIAVNGGTLTSTALSAGQTLELGAFATVVIGRYDPGSTVAFEAPDTLRLAKGIVFDASVRNFGVGDAIDLSGYLDYAPTGVSANYNGETVTVSSNGNKLVTIDVGPGYDPAGFQITQKPLPGVLVTDYVLTYAPPNQPAPTPPGISGAHASQITDAQTATPFAGVTLSEATPGATVTVTVTQGVTYPSSGVLSAPGGGTFSPSGTLWSDTGTVGAVQAALAALVFTPTARTAAPGKTTTTGFTVSVNDQTGTATDTTTSVVATAVEDPLLVTGVTPVVYTTDLAQPFHHIVLSDPDNATYTATATLSGAGGTITGDYYSTIDANGVFHVAGSLATVQQALRDLVVYTSANLPTGQSTQTVVTYSISNGASQTLGGASTINTVATGVADAAGMKILGAAAGQAVADVGTINPFSSMAVLDPSTGVNDTLTVTLSDPANGALSDPLGGVFDNGTFTYTSTVANSDMFADQIDKVLAALVFTPTQHQVALGQTVMTGFTVTVSNSAGSTTDAATSVIATSSTGFLTISGAQANQEFSDVTSARPLSGVTLYDTTVGATETATVTLSSPAAGALAIGDGGVVGADGVFRISGTLAAVQAALQALAFVPAPTASGQVATTGLTVTLSDGAESASDNTTSLIVVGTRTGAAPPPAPTVTISPVGIINHAVANASGGVALSGAVSGLAAGATFQVSVSDGSFAKTYTATVDVSGAAWSATIPEADAILLPDGTGTVSAQATNSAGVTSATVSATVTVAETPPTVTISPVGVINHAVANGSGGVSLGGTVTGLAADATFQVSVTDGSVFKTYTAIVDATGTGWSATIPQSDAVALPDGTATVSATATDVNGNAATSVSETATVAETPPTLTISPVGVINHAVANGSGGVSLGGTVAGLAADATFQVSVTDGSVFKTYTAIVDATGTGWSATIPQSDAVALPDGTATVSATATDVNGNASTPVSETATVAETPPTLTISPVGHGNVIDDSVARAVGGVAIGGTVAGLAAGATFQVAVTDGSFTGIYTATVDSTGARWNAVMPKSDATVLANGTATVSAQATDAYGNVSVRVADAVSVKLTGTATGDVHMVTYDGLRYDFQAVGMFVLTRSTTPGDDFQIQIETSSYPLNHAASVTTQAAVQLGDDVLLFDPGAKDFVSVDGAADSTLGAADPTQVFAAGKLVKVSSSEYQVQWNSGETLTLFDRGYYIDTSVALGPRNGPGSVQGLLGPDNGQANDFQLPNGSVLAQPLSRSELYGAFANAWSVTTSDSLFGDAAATSAATGATPLKLVDSPNGHDVLEATSQGETLTATSGGVILSDARELGATFAGTLPVLSSDLISGFSSKDSIDVFGVNGADTTLSYAGSSAMGVLTVSEGSQAGELYLSGALSGGSFHVSSDGTGGARITFG